MVIISGFVLVCLCSTFGFRFLITKEEYFEEEKVVVDEINEKKSPFDFESSRLALPNLSNNPILESRVVDDPEKIAEYESKKEDYFFDSYADFRIFIDSINEGFLSWENWDRESFYVGSYAYEYSKENNTLDLVTFLPTGKDFSNVYRKVRLDCRDNKANYVSNINFDILDFGVNMFEVINHGDVFFAYCLDEDCNIMGRSCILIQQKKINEEF